MKMTIRLNKVLYSDLVEHAAKNGVSPSKDISLMLSKKTIRAVVVEEDLNLFMLSENNPVFGLHTEQADLIDHLFSVIWRDVYTYRQDKVRKFKVSRRIKHVDAGRLKEGFSVQFNTNEDLEAIAIKNKMSVDDYVRAKITASLQAPVINDFEMEIRDATLWCKNKKADVLSCTGSLDILLNEIIEYLEALKNNIEERIISE